MEPGDIVQTADGQRHVLVEFVPQAGSNQFARCIRRRENRIAQRVIGLLGLTFVETPAFIDGERITIGRLPGRVTASDSATRKVTITLDSRTKPLASDPRYRVQLDDGQVEVPLWQLVLENRKELFA
jgi:hypothetical protein